MGGPEMRSTVDLWLATVAFCLPLTVAQPPSAHCDSSPTDDAQTSSHLLPPGAVRRFVPNGGSPGSAILSVAFSPDGKIVATAGDDQQIHLFDAATGEARPSCRGHRHIVLAVAFSPDGKQLASGSADRTLRIWDASIGKELHRVTAHEVEVAAVAFSPDGKTIATGGGDRIVRLWDPVSGKERIRLAGARRPIRCLAFSPDSKTVVAGGWDRTIRRWDVSSGKEVEPLRGHKSCVLCLAFTADGKTLVSGGRDQTVRVWDLWSGKTYLRLAGWNGEIRALALSRSLDCLASADANQSIRFWDLNTGNEVGTLKEPSDNVLGLAFSPNGESLLTGSADGTVLLWDAKAVVPARQGRASNYSQQEFDALWDTLATDDDDPDVCFAIHRLIRGSDQTVSYFQQRLPAVSVNDIQRVADLVGSLDDDRYPVREKATLELLDRGPIAVPILRQELQRRRPSLESRRRMERILEKLPLEVLSGYRAREQRAIQVLERMRSPSAERLLEQWAKGAAAAPLTQEAQTALLHMRQPR